MWPPLHGVLAAAVLLAAGPDYRWAVLPSLAGWAAAVFFACLSARRAVRRGRDLAGLVAALFVLVSPAYRAYATDVMLESLGAGLSMAALYCYLTTVQGRGASPWPARCLGLVLTLLFLHKYNYWTLVVVALTGADPGRPSARLVGGRLGRRPPFSLALRRPRRTAATAERPLGRAPGADGRGPAWRSPDVCRRLMVGVALSSLHHSQHRLCSLFPARAALVAPRRPGMGRPPGRPGSAAAALAPAAGRRLVPAAQTARLLSAVHQPRQRRGVAEIRPRGRRRPLPALDPDGVSHRPAEPDRGLRPAGRRRADLSAAASGGAGRPLADPAVVRADRAAPQP